MLQVMRIAILYSGVPEPTDKMYRNHYDHIISKYNNVDIYYSTYIINSQSEKNIKSFENLFEPKKISIETFEDVKKNILENMASSIRFTTNDTRPINALSMFYKIKKAFDLIEDTQYDIVIRNRTDIMFNSDLIIQHNDTVNIPNGGDYHGGLLDMFAYGQYDVMKKYCSFFDQVKNYFMDNSFLFHPESSLRYHCVKNQINIKRFNYDIFLRGNNFTKSAPYWSRISEDTKNSKYL